jgi:PucR C-terminal helix-turn-helix domain
MGARRGFESRKAGEPCHPDTVRHRRRRIETLTGRSLSDPLGVKELCLALEAVRSQPELLSSPGSK